MYLYTAAFPFSAGQCTYTNEIHDTETLNSRIIVPEQVKAE